MCVNSATSLHSIIDHDMQVSPENYLCHKARLETLNDSVGVKQLLVVSFLGR